MSAVILIERLPIDLLKVITHLMYDKEPSKSDLLHLYMWKYGKQNVVYDTSMHWEKKHNEYYLTICYRTNNCFYIAPWCSYENKYFGYSCGYELLEEASLLSERGPETEEKFLSFFERL